MNMASVNERDLLAAATQGSQVAYRELIHLHQAAVYRFAWAMIGEEHAQTVTENAFITAWRQLEFLPAINLSFHTHLLQLVCIDCTELAKRQRRHRVNLNAQTDEDTLNFPFGPCAMIRAPIWSTSHCRQTSRTRCMPFRCVCVRSCCCTKWATYPTRRSQIFSEAPHKPFTLTCFVPVPWCGGRSCSAAVFSPASTEGNETAPAQFRACKSYLSTLSAATDGLCTSEEKRALRHIWPNAPAAGAITEL